MTEIERLRAENEALRAELSDAHDTIEGLRKLRTILENSYKSEHEAHLNRTAHALAPEYVDFLSAMDMEMTLDLGENLRLQLKQVFKTLRKNGIDVTKYETNLYN